MILHFDTILKALNEYFEEHRILGNSSDIKQSEIELFRKHERTGRPLGKTTFVKQLETILDRRLRPKKPGRKKNK